MEKIYYQTLKETLFHEKLENGLEVYLLPKVGFEKTYGLFSTNFGSIDTTFVPLGQKEMVKVEDGIAHFLEHKMFDMKDGDAADKFAKLGASSNAFTSSSRTAYLFSTTTNENACVELLLDFVQSLDITDESVEKEKGIICQEIKMYDDDPDWRVYFGAIANLYHNHPVRIDIAGTCDTVNNTYKDMLELCYHTFYHPHNMMLFVVGNIQPEELVDVIKENQNKKLYAIEHQIQRIQLLVNDLQTIALLDSHNIQYCFKEYDLQMLIDEIEEDLDYLNPQIRLNKNIKVLCDEKWFIEALENIIKNCLEKNSTLLSIFAYKNETTLKMMIQDQGNGFKEKDLPFLFQRFYRGENSKGTGLGLYIAKEIIEAHHGFIKAYNQQGACFEIVLPQMKMKKKI